MKELDKELEYYREFRLKSIKESQRRRINGGGRVKLFPFNIFFIHFFH